MKTIYKLNLQKVKQKGDIDYEYHPFRNLRDSNGSIKDFTIKNTSTGFNFNLENPVDIQCQQSYDGTVNLILNDGINSPKIINSRWTQDENDTYKIIDRSQIKQSNIYNENYLNTETSLFRSVRGVPKIDLQEVSYTGKLKVGNYIFYIKYMDEDFNETEVVGQSGVVSIFNGTYTSPNTVSGGIMDEESDKSISLYFRDLDTSFAYLKIYVYRTTCDTNGVKLNYAYKIDTDYKITDSNQIVNINGFEPSIDISIEELNINYLRADSVQSQAQVQNMLFFANITQNKQLDPDLQLLSLYIKAEETQSDSIGLVSAESYQRLFGDDVENVEYYSPINIYYKLGYWPDELYRFGIVYIYDNDKLSPVYNIRGCRFDKDRKVNIKEDDFDNENKKESKYFSYKGLDKTDKIPVKPQILKTYQYINTGGVFQFSKDHFKDIITNNGVKPIGIRFSFNTAMLHVLHNKNIKGFFFVRQERIPTILCQGYSVGINKNGYFPMIKYNDYHIAETFADNLKLLEERNTNTSRRLCKVDDEYLAKYSALLCNDAYLNKNIQSILDSSEFIIENIYDQSNLNRIYNNRFYYPDDIKFYSFNQSKCNLVYVDQDVPFKMFHDDCVFSTKAGIQEDIKYSAYIFEDNKDLKWKPVLEKYTNSKDESSDNQNYSEDITNQDPFALIRGSFSSIIGCNKKLDFGHVFNIRVKNYNDSFLQEYFNLRLNDNSPYFQIGNRYCITPSVDSSDWDIFGNKAFEKNISNIDESISIGTIFGGDCFTATSTIRLHRNFISSSVPANDIIVKNDTFKQFTNVRDTPWEKINKADIDAVPIGTWITYKCLSNFNMSLRSKDPFQIDEQAIFGNERSFFPVHGISTKSVWKIPESNLLNQGYSSLLGVKRNFVLEDSPYDNDLFDTRIMFSNIQVDGEFKNSYRVFQGLSYEDIDRQYGSITKIIPWGVNLFCVFEHGLALIPVNEKALIQTNTGQNIHMYGAGVLQKQVVLISDQVGSIWKDSIVKTPLALYGVDSHTHKIWRYSNESNLEILSDFKVQRFLHDNINLKQMDKNVVLGIRNVKTHYNAFKGDVMFTYYNGDVEWNLCYNENIKKWVTRYSWVPLLSENIDYSMFSFDSMRTKIFSILNTNLNRANNKNVYVKYNNCKENGVINENESIGIDLMFNSEYTYYNIDSISVKGFFWDNTNNKINYENIGYKGLFKGEDKVNSSKIYESNIDRSLNISEQYNKYIEIKERGHNLSFNAFDLINTEKYLYFNIDLSYTPYFVYTDENDSNNNSIIFGSNKKYTIGLIKSYDLYKNNSEYHDSYCNALINSIYVHGRSLNADEINYTDYDLTNQCLPTKWYDRQEPFEFEIVVAEPKGAHKLFNNLMIISNNVEPDSLEIEITGDAYTFDKSGIFKYKNNLEADLPKDYFVPNGNINGESVYNTEVKFNPVEGTYSLLIHQELLDIKKHGRRLGNIIYNEDKWYITLSPIYYKHNMEENNGDLDYKSGELRSTKIRDKYAKVRVKYKGDKLVVLVALQTIMTLSYV